jgi:hypothetical protein
MHFYVEQYIYRSACETSLGGGLWIGAYCGVSLFIFLFLKFFHVSTKIASVRRTLLSHRLRANHGKLRAGQAYNIKTHDVCLK